MLSAIVLAPLVGAILLGVFGRRMRESAIGSVACLSVGVSTILSFYVFFTRLINLPEDQRVIQESLFTWISTGTFRSDFSFLLDPLSGVYILFVTFVAFWIHVFATGYMRGDRGYWRFFAYLNLFMFSMLTLVLADNFLLMFVGWEGVGLCSYLLIGYYFQKNFANDAAKKAFIVNRIGDFGFALGLLFLFLNAGTIFYFDDPARGVSGAFNWAVSQAVEPLGAGTIFAGGLTTIAVLLFVGAIGKSAQIPLFVWLPDAMAGPTPVSALIHAATMVTAGVYMVARSSSIFVNAPTAMMIVAIIGAATAFMAATIGIAQWDIKKVLAYSTISQLGYMFLACGVGAFVGGIFHVFTHAFFKALLFLGAGSVIIALHHEQDLRRMGGLRKHLPITFGTMMIGWLAIAGIPPLSGFFSKDDILFKTFITPVIPGPWPTILWVVGIATALLTAVYMTRLMVLAFFGGGRTADHDADQSGHEHHGSGTPRESPASMTIPLIVLAVCAAVAGLAGVPSGLTGGALPNYFEHFLDPAIAAPTALAEAVHAHHATEIMLMVVSVVVAALGIGLAFYYFSRNPLWRAPDLLEKKYYVDEIYDATLVNPIRAGATGFLWRIVDVRIIDGAVNGAAAIAREMGRALGFLQSGFARSYVAIVVLGALLVVGYFMVSLYRG